MKVYKIYDERSNKWMRAGGNWTEKEDLGKVWKKKNHAMCALKNYFECNNYLKSSIGIVDSESTSSIEIVVYEIKEVERINYV